MVNVPVALTTKPWYTSITLWAIKAAAVLTVLPDVVTWADTNLGVHLATSAVVVKVLTIAALVVAWIKRFTADKILTK